MGNNGYENQDENGAKIRVMWESLSGERQTDINTKIINSIKKFEGSGQLEYGKTYPLEFTFGFDKEEPIQYVYLMCAFRIVKSDKPIQINKNLPPTTSIVDIAMRDIEVFKKDQMFNWLDHVNRINKTNEQNKEDQLFYENNIFKGKENEEGQKKNEGDDSEKKSSQSSDEQKNNPNQCHINKPIDDKNIIMGSDMFGRFSVVEEPINENKYILHGIDEKELFDFYTDEMDEKSNDEYLSLFRLFSRNIVNQVTQGYYGHKIEPENKSEDEKEESSIIKSVYSLKKLQIAFCKCDFWKFNQYELGQLGFINWNDELLLIPVWAFPVILRNSREKIVYTPSNEETIIKNIDIREYPSTKYGCVPYGFKINQVKK